MDQLGEITACSAYMTRCFVASSFPNKNETPLDLIPYQRINTSPSSTHVYEAHCISRASRLKNRITHLQLAAFTIKIVVKAAINKKSYKQVYPLFIAITAVFFYFFAMYCSKYLLALLISTP